MLKAIIMDMDGTLLAPGDHILPETKQKLLELERQGVTLILASGRSYTRLLPYADQLDMAANGGYLIEVDGISLYDMGAGEREVLRRMDPSEIREVYTDLMHLNCEAQACFDDGFFDYFDEDIRRKKEQLRKERNLPDDFPWTAGPWDWRTCAAATPTRPSCTAQRKSTGPSTRSSSCRMKIKSGKSTTF